MPSLRLYRLITLSIATLSATMHGAAATAAPGIVGRSYILLDGTSHRVLIEKNADERLQPASLTKLMTAYVVFDAVQKKTVRWEQLVHVASADIAPVADDEATMHLRAGDVVSVHDLVAGLIVVSANDAAMVLARTVAGSSEAFLTRMNNYARNLGLHSSHFATPSGITTKNHYSTARDIALLSFRLTEDFPAYLSFSAQRDFTYRGFLKRNKNRLLAEDASVDGLKTGHTAKAGYCLAVTARRAVGNGYQTRRVFAVVLGASSNDGRFSAGKALIDYAF